MQLSSRVKGVAESVTLKLNTRAQELQESGKQVFNLTAGQLPYRPPVEFIDHLRSELDFLKSFQYAPVAGFQDLRKKIMSYTEESRNIHFKELEEEFDCLISNGAKHSITNILGAMINPGDEVIVLSPFWISYPEIIKFCRGEPVVVSSNIYDVYTPSINDIRKVISSKTKAIIVNSPNNPAGIHYSDQWMSEFADFLLEHPQLNVISDEIYFAVSYYDPKPTYFYQKKPELLKRTVIVDGISKSLAATGLRIGWCIAPKAFVTAMERLQGQTTSSANSLVQRALMNYDFNQFSQFLIPVKNHLRENAIVIRDKFKDANLAKCWYQPVSAFYFMIEFTPTPVFNKYRKDKFDQTDYSMEICEDLLNEHGVAIVPGRDFGLPNTGRISLVLPKESFSLAMEKIVTFLQG